MSSGQCIDYPLLLPSGGVACSEQVEGCRIAPCPADQRCDLQRGVCVGRKDGRLTEQRCGSSCLDGVDCVVTERVGPERPGAPRTTIPKCPSSLFLDTSLSPKDCGDHCPCWRIIPRADRCLAHLNVSPFGLEILRKDAPIRGTVAIAACSSSPFPWSHAKIRDAPFHCNAPAVAP